MGDVNSQGCYNIGGVPFACSEPLGGIALSNITLINGQPPIGGGGGNPGPPSGSIQFNNAGAFGGSPLLFWDSVNTQLNVVGFINTTQCIVIDNSTFACTDGAGGVALSNITSINGAAPPSQTPWLSNIDAANHGLINCASIRIGTNTPINSAEVLTTLNSSGYYTATFRCTAPVGAGTVSVYNDIFNSSVFGISGSQVTGDRQGGSYIFTTLSKFLLQVGNGNNPCLWAHNASSTDNRIGVNKSVASGVPAYTVDVNGSINVTGNYYINGVPLATGGFWVGGSGGVIYYNGGDVGIGTPTPLATLDVAGTIRSLGGAANPTSGAGMNITFSAGVGYVNTYNFSAGNYNSLSIAGAPVNIAAIDTANGYITFSTNNPSTEKVRIAASGNVGIGTNAPTYQLQLSTDSAAKPSTNTWTVPSDIRTKQNVQRFYGDMDIIRILDPIIAEYNGFADTPSGARVVGFAAQELQDILPQCVSVDDNGILGVNTHEIFFHMLRAIQYLDQQVTFLTQRLETQ